MIASPQTLSGDLLKVNEVMFELSHELRVFILEQLAKTPMRLSEVSKMLEITTAEVSRHLDRLVKTNFIEKRSDNLYYLTNYGGMLLFGYGASIFLIENSAFFANHTLNIPPVLASYGPLANGKINRGTLNNTTMVTQSSKEAKQYIYVISDEVMRSLTELDIARSVDGVEVKKIYPARAKIPDAYKKSKIEIRIMDEIPFSLKLTEKQAGLAFFKDTSIDFDEVLIGDHEDFRYWLQLLFNYFWNLAKPYKP
jgi:predicted transcriptional regulator